MENKIFVVTVTYGNRFHLLKQVIDAALEEGVYKIIVVDNNSESESKNKLIEYERALNGKIKVLYLDDNYGSAGGYKRGLEEAYKYEDCEYILLLDDDNILSNHSIKKLKKYTHFFKSKYENFAISCMRNLDYLYLFLQNKSNIFNNCFYRGFNILNLVKKRYYKNKKTNNIFNNFHNCSLIKVAPYGGLFFNKNVLKDIGFPNEKFYLYADDFEYTFRMSKKYKIILLKNLKIKDIDLSWEKKNNKFHLVYHPFINEGTELKTYYLFRNSDYLEQKVFKKHGLCFIINKFIYIGLLIFIALVNLKFNRIKTIIKSLKDAKEME